jgi:hypothetical protein
MYSNQKNIILFDGETKHDWSITPSLNPDVFRSYSATEGRKRFKFISDIDSLEFVAEVNKLIYVSIIYKGDTAHTVIDFTNRFASKLSDSEKLYALSLFWSEAKYNFAFIDKLRFDLDSLYKTFIPKVLATTNDYEFYDVMKLFAGCFHDGHTQVYYLEDSYTDYVPMLARYFDDELRVINVKESIAATFPVGSTIIEINGLKTEEYMRKYIAPYIASDYKPTVQRLAASDLLAAKLPTDTLTIKYRTPENKILTNPLVRDGRNREGEPSVGYQRSYWKDPVEITWQENDIAVLAFNTFNDRNGELIARFEKLKDTLYHAKGIIIDLRQNGGGSTNVAWRLLQYIIKDSYFLNFAWQTRTNDGVKKAQGNFRKEYERYYKNAAYRTVPADTVFIPDSIKRFDVPIAVLFSTMTVSAAEDFLIILYERSDRPLFVGQPSFGSTGSPLMIWGFPDNGFARICARRVLFPYSMRPFTEGIQPDIPVNYTFDEFMSGKDKDMEVAVQELQKQIWKNKKITIMKNFNVLDKNMMK